VFFVQLSPKRSVLRTEPADQLLILLEVILHRPHLVFLHAAIASNEIAVRVALATGDRERQERNRSEPRYSRAVQSRYVRAKLQDDVPKRLGELLPQTRGKWPEVGFPRAFNRKVPR
jgi:hypothetical protein